MSLTQNFINFTFCCGGAWLDWNKLSWEFNWSICYRSSRSSSVSRVPTDNSSRMTRSGSLKSPAGRLTAGASTENISKKSAAKKDMQDFDYVRVSFSSSLSIPHSGKIRVSLIQDTGFLNILWNNKGFLFWGEACFTGYKCKTWFK